MESNMRISSAVYTRHLSFRHTNETPKSGTPCPGRQIFVQNSTIEMKSNILVYHIVRACTA